MTDPHHTEEFRSHVARLVAEGKLSSEDAEGLLEGLEELNCSAGPAQIAVPLGKVISEVTSEAVRPQLHLEVSGYALQVMVAEHSGLTEPELRASQEGRLILEAQADGWRLRPSETTSRWNNLRAVLTLPFVPQGVRAEVSGGSLSLPDVAGQVRAEVSGGLLRMGAASSLRAEVGGGSLSAGSISGPSKLDVNGGNLILSHATALSARVNGGNLDWTGLLTSGTHQLEVNAGQANLRLLPGSDLAIHADVTVGSFKANVPLTKVGQLLSAQYSGQIGAGHAHLQATVTAGQVKLQRIETAES